MGCGALAKIGALGADHGPLKGARSPRDIYYDDLSYKQKATTTRRFSRRASATTKTRPAAERLAPPEPARLERRRSSASSQPLTLNTNSSSIVVDPTTHQLRASVATGELTAFPLPRGSGLSRRSSRGTLSPQEDRFDEGGRFVPVKLNYSDLNFTMTIGAGTYGEVSRGFWGQRKVAIKSLFPPAKNASVEETSELRFDFDREVEILSKVSHPRIIEFLGFVDSPRRPLCMVFELCEGNVSSLLNLVRHGTFRVSFGVCMGLSSDAAEAVHYLHRQRPAILHRDLKAENLLITKDFRGKLTDFGLSRAYDAMRPSIMTVCGTPCWVAPEIFRGEAYGEKVDVYSFGVLLWEIFAGKKPYADKECAEIPVLVGTKGLRPPRLSHVPGELNALMNDCWDEDPERRPGFGAIRARLDRITRAIDAAHRLRSPVHPLHRHEAAYSPEVAAPRRRQPTPPVVAPPAPRTPSPALHAYDDSSSSGGSDEEDDGLDSFAGGRV